MAKRLISLFAALCLLVCLFPVGVFAAEKPESFLRGVGQLEEVPEGYTAIYDEAGLRAIENGMSGKYILMNDIRLEGDWECIGSSNTLFKGVLDGNGYTISNLTQYVEAKDGEKPYLGLFARLYQAEIRNLKIECSLETYVKNEFHKSRYGGVYMGAVAAYSEDSLISNCIAQVSLKDNQTSLSAIGLYHGFGGITGICSGGRIEYCRVMGGIDTHDTTGGIAGEAMNGAELFACLNEAGVAGDLSVGGIVGEGGEVYLSSCANEGQVVAADSYGGIIGASGSASHISDCINLGELLIDGSSGGFCYGGGITMGAATVERCVHAGFTRFGAIRSASDVDYPLASCYFLEGSASRLSFSPSNPGADDEGMLTAEQMKDPESFEGFYFPGVWTLEEGMDYPYPSALLGREMENPFKLAYVNELLRGIKEGESRLSIFEGSGEGSLAAVLSDTYEEAGLHIVNKGWKGISCINDCMSFDFDVENDFDVLLADLLMACGGMEGLGDLAGTEIFGEFSDMVTHLCNSVEGLSTLEEVQTNLTEAGKLGGGFSDEAQSLMNSTNSALSGKISMGDVNKAFTFLGCVTDTVGAGVESVQDLVDYFVLVNAYDGAGSTFSAMLGDIAAASSDVESKTGKDWLLRSAVNTLRSDMDAAIAGDPLALYNKMGQEIVDLGQTGANCIVNICSGFSDIMPVAAGIRMGFGMGVFFGDQVTNMDDISYYGTMMDMAGYLAKCCFKVAMDYKAAFEAEPSYENALRLNSITELYLRIQSLSCQYAFGYSMALADKSIFREREHIEAANAVMEYKMKIDALLSDGEVITIDPNGGISGFVASCPVTVIVEDGDGREIARLESGKETRTEGYADYYCVFGENMDTKAGLYGEGQSIRIVGEAGGSMDLLLFDSVDGEPCNARMYEDVPVNEGDEFVPQGLELAVNGGETIKPQCPGDHSWDEGEVTEEPDCLNEGKKRFSCLVCGRGGSLDLPALGHDWDEGTVAKQPSLDEEGEMLFRCSRCKETKTELIDKIEIPFEPFLDVPENAYYYDAVEWAVRRGVTSGVGGGLFAPETGCTRAQVVTFLYRAAGQPTVSNAENPFGDVKSGEYYYDAVLWAVENGITGGVSPDSFAPDATCTRGQIVTFLYRAAGEPELGDVRNPFWDMVNTDYFYDAVLWAVEDGITSGMDQHSFAPGSTCTRGQIVTFLYRYYN